MYEVERFTLAELVEKSSVRYRGKPALAMLGGKALLYEELESGTRRVAALLDLLGARPGDRVAILAENSPEWGLAYLALARSGCVAVPILTDFANEQIANILDHSESRIVFASRRFLPKLSAAGAGRLIVAIEDLSLLAGGPARTVAFPDAAAVDAALAGLALPEIRADDLAAIVYTSGTTGNSKGVMLTHRNLVHNARAVGHIMRIGPADRLLAILPLAHTYEFSVGFLYPLMQGSSIHFLDRPPSASVLLPALGELRPSIMLTVPLIIEKIYFASVRPALERIPLWKSRLARPLLERLAGVRLKRSFGGKLRIFGIGGAPLAPEVEAFLHRIRFPCAMGYGLTETSPLAAGSGPRGFRLRSIGPAIHGTALRIAGPRAEGGEGEIQVRGPNVMAGYYKDPERTAEAFTADGWLRTGDLGFIDRRGRLSVRGRIKTVIIGASGENIYPEEVEALLNSSPQVAESLVYGDRSGLTALVQLKPELLKELGARVQDRIEHAGESLANLERAAAQVLELVKREANARLAAFSRIGRVRLQVEPFEKTPTQKIKRFLYTSHTQEHEK
ncbi:MAG: AMP-binding protein [Rectinemataceae bacterium]